MALPSEIIVTCPSCKQLEFLEVFNGRGQPNSAYRRNNGHVFHKNCPEPCRLFQIPLMRQGISI